MITPAAIVRASRGEGLIIECPVPECQWWHDVYGGDVALSALVDLARVHHHDAHPEAVVEAVKLAIGDVRYDDGSTEQARHVLAAVRRSVTDPRNPCHAADDCTHSIECERYDHCVDAGPQCTECRQGPRNDCIHFTAN